jgi:hypothetical protein
MENKELPSIKIPAGKRTYFLDIKKSREGIKYLVISESKLDDKGAYQRERVMVFHEHFPALFEGLVKIAPELGVNMDKRNSLTEIRELHHNAYAPWSSDEDDKLERLFCEGKSTKELAAIFQRQPGAITSRIKKLELREKYDR